MPDIKAYLLTILMALSGMTFATKPNETNIENRLIEAITCQHESPADLVREIARKTSSTLTINNHKNGYDEKITIKTNKPLRLHGVLSDAVHLSFENDIKDFNAIVYSVFKGDPQSMIKALNLSKDNSATRIADYTNKSNSPDCPPTIGLTRINKSTFALGCGWCNGG
ncbi:hypothetical protein [Chitinibacter sp. GC72]|uniref:hypothetical protein n=1 Tax=Chitinibacter sp. GC72 TaxID=1526917 RepID=UPI0012F9E59B|nr:hypothetical protein [Chitinibacter sp. GC72]